MDIFTVAGDGAVNDSFARVPVCSVTHTKGTTSVIYSNAKHLLIYSDHWRERHKKLYFSNAKQLLIFSDRSRETHKNCCFFNSWQLCQF